MGSNHVVSSFANVTAPGFTSSADVTDSFLEHLVAGCFFLAFGGFFLALTAYRINRIATALAFLDRSESAAHNHFAESNEPIEGVVAAAASTEEPADHVTLWARTFCRQHIPEYETNVVYRTSVALIFVTISGLILESVDGVWFHFEKHRESTFRLQKVCRIKTRKALWLLYPFMVTTELWKQICTHMESGLGLLSPVIANFLIPRLFASTDTIVSNELHETIALLFLAAGVTGWWEAAGYLPRDSLRAALVFAFGGEAILWHIHALTKQDSNSTWMHEAISWLAAGTAIIFLLSIIYSNPGEGPGRHDAFDFDGSIEDSTGNCPCTLFFLYISAFILIVWQGCWIITTGQHESSPLQTEQIPCYFVLQGLLLFVFMQSFLIALLRKHRPKRHYGRIQHRNSSVRERSPATVELELNGA